MRQVDGKQKRYYLKEMRNMSERNEGILFKCVGDTRFGNGAGIHCSCITYI